MPILSKPIVLVGPMGCGKSTIGKLLSNETRVKFIDSDNHLEKNLNISITEIFNIFGERYFREMEEKFILSLETAQDLILATGGGSIISSNVRNFFRENFFMIYIKADIDTIWSRVRLNSENRPLISNDNGKMGLERLLANRSRYYSEAHLTVESTINASKFDIVKTILVKLKQLSIIDT